MITTEEAERLATLAEEWDRYELGKKAPEIAWNWKRAPVVIRSLAAECDALRAERNAEVGHRLKAEGALFNMERRIARQRRALAKLYRKRHDRKAENARLRKALSRAKSSFLQDESQKAFIEVCAALGEKG